jgi:hypothetical protein
MWKRPPEIDIVNLTAIFGSFVISLQEVEIFHTCSARVCYLDNSLSVELSADRRLFQPMIGEPYLKILPALHCFVLVNLQRCSMRLTLPPGLFETLDCNFHCVADCLLLHTPDQCNPMTASKHQAAQTCRSSASPNRGQWSTIHGPDHHCRFALALERMTVAIRFMVSTKASNTSAVPY